MGLMERGLAKVTDIIEGMASNIALTADVEANLPWAVDVPATVSTNNAAFAMLAAYIGV